MPLFFTQPPAEATQALEAVMPRLAEKTTLRANAPDIAGVLESVESGQIPANVTAPVHIVGLKDIVSGDARKAPLKLWTHMLHAGEEGVPQAAADVDAETMRFAAISEGPDVRSLGANVREAQRAAAGATEDYDLAVLRVPALYLSAVWLKGRNGAQDVLIPGESPKSPLQAGKRCDLAIWNIERPAELVYRIGFNPLHARVWGGA